MKMWTKKELLEAGYQIVNGIIDSANIFKRPYEDLLMCNIWINSEIGKDCIESRTMGEGEIYGDFKTLKGYGDGIKFIMALLWVVGTEDFGSLSYKCVRVAVKDGNFKMIGNIIKDKWLDVESFYRDEILK